MQHSPMFSLRYYVCEDAFGWYNVRMVLMLVEIGVLQESTKSNYIVVLVRRQTSDDEIVLRNVLQTPQFKFGIFNSYQLLPIQIIVEDPQSYCTVSWCCDRAVQSMPLHLESF